MWLFKALNYRNVYITKPFLVSMVDEKRGMILFVLMLGILLVPLSSAVLVVDKTASADVVIAELNNPAVFNLTINNAGQPDTFEIFSLVGVTMDPRGTFELQTGYNNVEVKAYPSSSIRQAYKGYFKFEYQIKGSNSGLFRDTMIINIVPLADTVEISGEDLRPGDNEAIVDVKNTQNTYIDNLKLSITSAFFNFNGNVSLQPYETAKIRVKVDKASASKISAGPYVLSAVLGLDGATSTSEGTINYVRKEEVVETRAGNGFIIRDVKITKANKGNVPVSAKIETSKDILTRLVTVYSVEPTDSQKSGIVVNYVWQKDLLPGESYSVTVTTNYTFPFIAIILIVLVIVFVRMATHRSLIVTKRVSLVKTKGGEFALRVRLHVKARKLATNIQVIDRLPGMTKLYEKFGAKPDKIDLATRRLFWTISKLAAGEERVFSYIVYSKVSVVGSFELPAATAVYEQAGQTHEVMSNKTFFVADTSSIQEE